MTYMIFLSSVILLLTVGTFAIQNSFADTTDLPENVSASIVQAANTVDTTPPLLTSLELRTSNTDSTRAKQGDIILIALYTDTHLSNASATILNRTVETDIIVSVVLFETIILAGDSGNTSFSVTVYDSSGNGLTITEADITSNNIFIDTAKPVITLNGPANITIERFDTYTDAGATITDEDPKYNGLVSSNASSINTSAIGSYLIEYHAPADLAGNVPASIVRTVNIVDTTLPLPTSLELRTSNTDSTRAKQGDIILISLYTDTRLSDASATILNRTVETTIIDNFVFFNTMILAGDSGNTSFSVTVYDSSGNRLTITEADITSNNIFIDTAKPVITLNGPANITIKRGMEYVDAGVMISDNDPAYHGIISSNATSLDTSYGGTYTIVYSAPPDPAGNEAKNATRTVIISPPFEIYNVAINTTNPNPGYAKENDTLVIKLESDMSLVNTSVSATVFGRQADYDIYDQILYVNQTVKKGDNGYVPFTILIQDNHGASILATNDDLQKNIIVDTIAPRVLSATTITPTLVSITFDESITTHPLTLRRTTMSPTPISITVQNGSSIPYSVLEFTMLSESPLSPDATPHITFERSAITDLAGNAFSEISITTSDGIAPSMQSATVVSPALIEVIFDEQVKFLDGNPLFHPPPTVNKIPSDTPRDISGNTLSIPSRNSFPIGAVLNVSIETNIITDMTGNVFKPSSILTDAVDVIAPYTVDELTIHVPYTMTLNPNTISTDDYRITFGSNPPSTISAAHLSNDTITVILTMNSPFGTGDIPFVEQIGSITDTFNNAVTIQSVMADDRAPPILVSAVASSTSDITVTFSEKITSKSTSIKNYDLTGATIRTTGLGIADGTVVISTSTFVNATLTIPNTATIEDVSGNILQGGVTQTVVWSNEAKNATRTVIISPPFEIYNVAINTTNPNPGYAKENDTLVIRLESDMSLVNTSISATVFGRQADYDIYDQILYVNQTVKKGDNGYVPFTILIQDNQNASILATNDDLQKNIIVDTIAPRVLSATTITPTLVSITFDESITTHPLTLRRTTMSPTPISITVQNGSSIPYSVLEFTMLSESPLSPDATPHITFERSAITDLAGNAFSEISITTSDGIAPSMQSATVVSPALIEVIFDEQVKFLDGNPLFHPPPTVNKIPSDTPRDISGNTLSIPSRNSFPIGAVLNVSIETNIITDMTGNVFKPSSILTDAVDVIAPYTVDELTIHVPYTMTLNPNTISTDDYRITFGSNPPSTISAAHLSNDTITVILTMNSPFGTGDIPFVEQIGSITDTFNNAVTIQSVMADDRAPPILVSAVASSTSDITVTFSEKITSKSTSIKNYDLTGATIRTTGLGIADGTVVISTSTFVNATLTIPNTATIEDVSGNILQGGVSKAVVWNQ